MLLMYTGKTKNVYALEDGNLLLEFKDNLTGTNGVFDPGANSVGLQMEGAGKACLKLTKYFFELFEQARIPTHYIEADIEKTTMTVKPATVFGKGLEVICRFKAVGSFYRRYGLYVEEGEVLDPPFVEVTVKDDKRNDPPIGEDALELLDILARDEYHVLKRLAREIAGIVKDVLTQKDIELHDIKFEFGRSDENHQIILIDEISGSNLRAFKNGKYLEPVELEKLILEE